MLASGSQNRRTNVIDEPAKVTWWVNIAANGVQRRIHCATVLMPQNHDQRHIQVAYGIFDGDQRCVICDMTRLTNNKKVAKTFIENDFRRYSGVGTSQNHRKGMLLQCDMFSPSRGLVRVMKLVFRKVAVALH